MYSSVGPTTRRTGMCTWESNALWRSRQEPAFFAIIAQLPQERLAPHVGNRQVAAHVQLAAERRKGRGAVATVNAEDSLARQVLDTARGIAVGDITVAEAPERAVAPCVGSACGCEAGAVALAGCDQRNSRSLRESAGDGQQWCLQWHGCVATAREQLTTVHQDGGMYTSRDDGRHLPPCQFNWQCVQAHA